MKTSKFLSILLLATILLSCGSKSGQRKSNSVEPHLSKQQYYLIVGMDSVKFMAQTDSVSYIFASQNLKNGDVVRLLQDGLNYSYNAKAVGPTQKKAVYYGVYPEIHNDFKPSPRPLPVQKDTAHLYLPL